MLDDYKLNGPTKKVDLTLETEVAKKLDQMVQRMKLSESEIINTALKRFISQHKDFVGTQAQ